MNKLSVYWSKGISSDYVQTAMGFNGERFKVVLIPERGKERDCFSVEAVEQGMERVQKFAYNDWQEKKRSFEMIKIVYDSSVGSYKVINVIYEDGSAMHVAE